MGNPVSCDICETKHLRTIIPIINPIVAGNTHNPRKHGCYVYICCNGVDKWLTKGEVWILSLLVGISLTSIFVWQTKHYMVTTHGT